MNRRDDAEQRVSTWLHDEAHGEVPDWVLRQAFERTRNETQQRGLRGRLTSITHVAGSRTRRRSSMFSMASLAAIVATTALATTAFLSVSLTPERPAGAPGAEAAPAAPVEFTGQTRFGPCGGSARRSELQPNGAMRDIGEAYYCVNPAEGFEDPRLQGEFRVWQNNDSYGGQAPKLWMTGFTMHDDDGSWIQRPALAITHADGSDATKVIVMDGQGDYEGLLVVAEVASSSGTWDWHGYIIDGDLPPAPAIELPGQR